VALAVVVKQAAGRLPSSTVAVIEAPQRFVVWTRIDDVPCPLSMLPALTDHLYVGVPGASVRISVTRPDCPAFTTSGALIWRLGHAVEGFDDPAVGDPVVGDPVDPDGDDVVVVVVG